MTIQFSDLAENQLILVRLSGKIGQSECRRLYVLLARHNAQRLGGNLLYDLSAVTDIDLTYAEMNGLIGLRREYYGASQGTRIGIWAPADMTFGMSRMYGSLLAQFDAVKVDVFRTLEDAADFVGVTLDALELATKTE